MDIKDALQAITNWRPDLSNEEALKTMQEKSTELTRRLEAAERGFHCPGCCMCKGAYRP